MVSHRYLFLGGLHRSGTTLVARLLARHPEVSGLTDTGAPEDEGQFLQTAYPPVYHFGGPGSWGFDPRAHLLEIAPEQRAAVRAQLLEGWRSWWDLRCPVLLEKSPPNLLKLRYLQSAFPDAHFIAVVRNPVEVTLATKRWARRQSVSSLFEHWMVCHDALAQDRRHIERFTLVRYEDLVTDPASTLEKIFHSIELEPAVVTGDVARDRGDRYWDRWEWMERHPLVRPYHRRLVDRFSDRAREHGYELRRPSRS
jgi:hypothetical protein